MVGARGCARGVFLVFLYTHTLTHTLNPRQAEGENGRKRERKKEKTAVFRLFSPFFFSLLMFQRWPRISSLAFAIAFFFWAADRPRFFVPSML